MGSLRGGAACRPGHGTRGGRIKQSYLYPGWGRGTGQGNTTPDCEYRHQALTGLYTRPCYTPADIRHCKVLAGSVQGGGLVTLSCPLYCNDCNPECGCGGMF